jgi:RimJ/RimL family protein N-acetyltransferase
LTRRQLILELRTPRLLLRGWRAEDRAPFAEMNADPVVREHFPSLLSRTESDRFADRIEAEFFTRGFGLWAVEIPGVAPFAGFTGLSVPSFEASFTPCVEIGWRLAREHWGRGYATEAARAAIEFGFTEIGLDEVVSFTVPANTRSVRVMEKLGMKFSGEFDFAIAEGHPLRRHVLYRLGRA